MNMVLTNIPCPIHCGGIFEKWTKLPLKYFFPLSHRNDEVRWWGRFGGGATDWWRNCSRFLGVAPNNNQQILVKRGHEMETHMKEVCDGSTYQRSQQVTGAKSQVNFVTSESGAKSQEKKFPNSATSWKVKSDKSGSGENFLSFTISTTLHSPFTEACVVSLQKVRLIKLLQWFQHVWSILQEARRAGLRLAQLEQGVWSWRTLTHIEAPLFC